MTDVLARRNFRAAANPEAIDAVHAQLDAVWQDAAFVPELDRMTFATAVIEAASNVVQHAEPAADPPVELGVDICVRETRLTAKVSAFNATPPAMDPAEPGMPDPEAESGRGLALIRALVTLVTFTRHDVTNTWTLSRDTNATPGDDTPA